MKIIKFDDIEKLNITSQECFQWVDDMLRQKKEAVLPAKISLHPTDDSFFNVMPCLLPSANASGVKVVTRNTDRVPSLDSQLMLYDYDTQIPKALMDGNWITTMRTGAVAVHSIKTLAKKDFKEIGVLGLGNTCRAAIKILLEVFPERELKIKVMKYKDQHIDFIKRFKGSDNNQYPKVEFTIVDDYKEVMTGSDVVISAVSYTDKDFCDPTIYKEGVLVLPIHTRGFMKCDLEFDKIFCDDRGHVNKFKYYDQWKTNSEVAEIITGEVVGRENDSERILVYNIGLSIHDIFFANKIYQKIINSNIEISLNPPKEKFWI